MSIYILLIILTLHIVKLFLLKNIYLKNKIQFLTFFRYIPFVMRNSDMKVTSKLFYDNLERVVYPTNTNKHVNE